MRDDLRAPMKVVGFDLGGRRMIGVPIHNGVKPIASMDDFWTNPFADAWRNVQSDAIPLTGECRLRPPVPLGARVICIGLNYRQHAEEAGLPIPAVPVVFARWTKSLTIDGTPAPTVDPQFDWEGELGVVIGRPLFRVDPSQGHAGIFGYCAFNDLSARTFQTQTSQWALGKNSDASGPMSPIVTVDEVGDPAHGLRIRTRVNGAVRQDSTTADMIFTVGEIISHVSQVMTLDPGDLIVTGTPSGVGFASKTFLKPGDVVEVEIEKIGIVRTPIIEAPDARF